MSGVRCQELRIALDKTNRINRMNRIGWMKLLSASVALCLCMLPLLTGCEGDGSSGSGRVIDSSHTGSFPAALISIAMALGDVPFFITPEHNIESYKVVYQTRDADGNAVQASGAVFLPEGGSEWPLLSIQHGTQTRRSDVASENPLLYGYEGVAAASGGYVVCIADYLGMGVSGGIHPYVHATLSANAVVDFIRACQTFCSRRGVELNGQLFLAGYSEGGYATLATQRDIEANHRDEFALTAVAAMAGSYDLSGTARRIMGSMEYSSPAFLAYFLTAYDDIYGWNSLDEIFQAPYGGMMRTLFDGGMSLGEINDSLPGSLSGLLDEGFVSSFLAGEKSAMDEALRENSLLDWAPVSPLRLLHGDADEIVSYQNALDAKSSFAARGSDHVEIVTVIGGTHRSSILPCLESAFTWFDAFR